MPESRAHETNFGSTKIMRQSFYEAGLDDNSTAPAQDPELFEILENVLPSTVGALEPRWGYTLFNNPGAVVWRRLYEAQSNIDNIRRIVAAPAAAASIKTFTEAGATGLTLFTTTGAATRAANSRDYVFFASGSSADRLKWKVSASATTTTNWGIDPPSQSQTSAGPRDPTVGASNATVGTIAWSNPGNIFSSNDVRADAVLSPLEISEYLLASAFGFTIPASSIILGIKAEIEKHQSTGSGPIIDSSVRLFKGGGVVGNNQAAGTWPSADAYTTYGVGTTDLWGETWTPDEINAANFGVGIAAINSVSPGGAETARVDHVRITVYYSVPITVGAAGAGAITLVSGRKYAAVFRNSLTGHYSDINEFSVSTGPITASNIPLTTIPVSTDSQVDRKVVLATADGGDETLLYELVDLPNATTSYTDAIPETSLLIRNVYLETDDFGEEFGVTGNLRPPDTGQFPTKHRGRIFMADGQLLKFSKTINELTTSTGLIVGRYEEAWPAEYQLDISAGAETIRGLLSDGQLLYAATERKIYRVVGDGPAFEVPESLFSNVGILNQDVWQVVLIEGTPAGAMWLTPDYKVIFSDFNTYRDVSRPIRATLDSINDTHASKAWAVFYSEQDYDLYLLGIPTGANTEPDTLCVFDVRQGKWFIWKPTDTVTAGLHNLQSSGVPQLIFGAGTGKLYEFDSAQTSDRVSDTPVAFNATAQTSWQDFGAPYARKLLQELELMTDNASLAVTIAGASTLVEFASPTAVVTSVNPVVGPLGEYKVFLAGSTTKDRYYRLKFVSAGSAGTMLGGYALEYVPLHDI